MKVAVHPLELIPMASYIDPRTFAAKVCVLVVLCAPAAQGQEYSDFRSFYQATHGTTVPQQTQAWIQTNSAQPAIASPPLASAYVPYSPYVVVHYGPLGGYLAGVADIIGARGQFLIDREQAHLLREQAREARIERRRMAFDEAQYERAMSPTNEEEREFRRVENVRRSLRNPPLTEIWSGKALNDLLTDIQTKLADLRLKGAHEPVVPVDADALHQINFTTGAIEAGSGVGLLKEGGRLHWPLALQAPAFQPLRERIEQLAYRLVKDAQNGQVDSDARAGLTRAVTEMQKELKRHVDTIPVDEYIAAKRFLNALEANVKTFTAPDIANYFNGKYEPQATDVAGLAREMTARGLRFAPAPPGSEAAYLSVHRSLATYDQQLDLTLGQERGAHALAAPNPAGRLSG
jgi:hypothetical protein